MEKIRLWLKTPYRLKYLFQNIAVKTFIYVLLAGLSFVYLYPFIFMIVTGLKSNADLNNITVNWVPTTLKFENLVIAFDLIKYKTFVVNSLVITIFATIGHVISCSLIGYGFARFNFPFKNVLFVFVIMAFIVPVQTLIVPLYITYKNFGWLDSFLPLIVPCFFGMGLNGSLFIFLFRQFYLTLPKDLENAAKIDGCGFFSTYLRIVFPLSQSSLLVTIVLSVVWHWNDFYEPGIYISKTSLSVLPSKISNIAAAINAPPEELFDLLELMGGEDVINNAVLMAGTFLVILPIIIFFSFAQKKFMQGIERTGITGE